MSVPTTLAMPTPAGHSAPRRPLAIAYGQGNRRPARVRPAADRAAASGTSIS
jgi:hypothetical protein